MDLIHTEEKGYCYFTESFEQSFTELFKYLHSVQLNQNSVVEMSLIEEYLQGN